MLIIGILASVALPQYQKAVAKARFSNALQRIATMRKQVLLFKEENPVLPSQRVTLLYDPAVYSCSDSATTTTYEGAIDLQKGLTCYGGGCNSNCYDDGTQFVYQVFCDQPRRSPPICVVEAQMKRLGPNKPVPYNFALGMELNLNSAEWTTTAYCDGKSMFLCRMAQDMLADTVTIAPYMSLF